MFCHSVSISLTYMSNKTHCATYVLPFRQYIVNIYVKQRWWQTTSLSQTFRGLTTADSLFPTFILVSRSLHILPIAATYFPSISLRSRMWYTFLRDTVSYAFYKSIKIKCVSLFLALCFWITCLIVKMSTQDRPAVKPLCYINAIT
jgi:hypothetical protein